MHCLRLQKSPGLVVGNRSWRHDLAVQSHSRGCKTALIQPYSNPRPETEVGKTLKLGLRYVPCRMAPGGLTEGHEYLTLSAISVVWVKD